MEKDEKANANELWTRKRNAAFSDAEAERRAKTLDGEREDSAANATYDENTSVHARRYKVIC